MRTVITLALAAALTAPAVSAGPVELPRVTQQASSVSAGAVRCEEDQPCWDCRRMGNRRCGPSKKAAKKYRLAPWSPPSPQRWYV